jgi:hypothetical protein
MNIGKYDGSESLIFQVVSLFCAVFSTPQSCVRYFIY